MIKLFTMNLHGLTGDEEDPRFISLCRYIESERPTVIALQEVSQRADSPALASDERETLKLPDGDIPDIPPKSDNLAYRLTKALAKSNVTYYAAYLPVKCGYDHFDEGLAVLSSLPIREAKGIYLSRRRDYFDWKTRMALKIKFFGNIPDTVCVHMGRYDDADEPFSHQWQSLREISVGGAPTFVLGDVNAPDEIRGEGYDIMTSEGLFDLCALSDAPCKPTVLQGIDGWEGTRGGIRIDHIFSSFAPTDKEIFCRRVFDGDCEKIISDHCGVELIMKRKKEEERI